MKSYHPAFDTLSETPLPEYRAEGIRLRHRETGCEVYHLRSEDEENTFAFCFRTPPADATGVAHIVEHSVLCGSERFPVKDAFLALARGSLATFLNAFTYPDKTVYPAASTVEADYFNLMDVYGDAVFRPRITRDIFLQEAHRLEYGQDGRLERKGVVYNEMRGDYSSPESLIATRTYQTLFSPGHPYHTDSGGDPEVIPTLTYEGFRAFWENYYHPSNCRIFLHGSVPTEKQLSFLEDRFLSAFQRRFTDTVVPVQEAFSAPVRAVYPFPAEEGGETKTTILVSWLTVPPEEGVDTLALEILGEILLGSDGASLYHALAESGLGEDLSPHSGLDTGLRQAVFSAGLRGTERGREEDIEGVILGCVQKLVREGIPRDLVEGAFHSVEFSSREIRRGGSTYGLRLLSRAVRGWLHGAPPERTLAFAAPLAELRRRMAEDSRYLENRLREWFLDNPHRATVTVYPDSSLAESLGRKHREELDELDASLDEPAREEIRARVRALQAFQDAPDEAAARDSLPRLGRGDIPRDIELVPRETADIHGARTIIHPIFTNGVVYTDFAFSLDSMPAEALPYLPLLSRFVTGAGLPGTPYDEVARALALVAGGFSAMLQSGTPTGAPLDSPSSWLVFRLKALGSNFTAALDLATDLMTRADFGDVKRLKDILNELANDVTAAIVPSGSSFASLRTAAGFSAAQGTEESWRGLSQFHALAALRQRKDMDNLARALSGILGVLVRRDRLRMNLTAGAEDLETARSVLEKAAGKFPQASTDLLSLQPADIVPPSRFEAWMIPAQVGFSAVSLPASRMGTPEFAQEQVLGHILSTSVLWDQIRVKGGAYGASAWTDGAEATFNFSSYRDPAPNASLGAYRAALETLAREPLEEGAMERAVVGAAGRDLRPMMPEEKGLVDFKRDIYGVTDEMRQRKRDTLLAMNAKELKSAAERILEGWNRRAEVLISHKDDIESMKMKNPAASVHQLMI